MKKWISKIVILTFAFTMLAGCNSNQQTASSTGATSEDTTSAEVNTTTLSGTISTNGSTSMDKVINSLIEAFVAENPGVTITYDGTGSSSGITAAADGTADIGLSSRNIKDSETGLDATVIALDGIAIIVNNSNVVNDLSIEQIAGLFTGEITNWNEAGGADAPVVLIGREGGSGTRDGFESIIGVVDACIYDQELTSTGAVITAVASNEYAIGYASLSAISDDTKTVTVEGIACTEETILNGYYAIQRPFAMVTSSEKELSAEAKAFIEFALSDEATEIIANTGAVQAQ